MDHLNVTTEIVDLDEARRRLPAVKAQVAIVMAATHALREIHARLTDEADPPKDPEDHALRERFAELELEFREALKAMNALGAYLKDPETGLVDFYTWKDGEMAFLCWRQGEDTIRHWHTLDGGFGTRSPLDS